MLSSTIHLRYPAAPNSTRVRDTYILYFITGNPGLIEYYRTFLSHLYALLSRSDSGQTSSGADQFQVYGQNLLGFEAGQLNRDDDTSPPYGLQAQIEATEIALRTLVCAETEASANSIKVILVGHSVGAFILLEVLRRHRERLRQGVGERTMTIAGGICLFPTIAHIAQSRSGKRVGALLCRPYFAHAASLIVKILLLFIPSGLLRLLIRMIMGFPPDAAATTTAFVKSRWGVRQALHMARDEMLAIQAENFDDDIWGAAHPSPSPYPRAQLRFLFGKEDHWVADETRDDLIQARASNGDSEWWKPKMEVDEVQGWPHAFCIRHSVSVAERVAEYVRDIINCQTQDVSVQK